MSSLHPEPTKVSKITEIITMYFILSIVLIITATGSSDVNYFHLAKVVICCCNYLHLKMYMLHHSQMHVCSDYYDKGLTASK